MKTAFVIINTKTEEYFSCEYDGILFRLSNNSLVPAEFSRCLGDARLYGSEEVAKEALLNLFWANPEMEIQRIGHIKNLKK